MKETRYTTCAFCDGGCALKATIETACDREQDEALVPESCCRTGGGGREESRVVTFSPANPAFPAICSKVSCLDEYRLHPARITAPLKNVGRRGEPSWREVTWDQALDEIAERLSRVVRDYGSEAVAFCETPLNHGFGGITRRFMGCIGTPNYTSPVELCMGNTAQVHRAVYGWMSSPDWAHADCIVYFGQNRGPERWPAEYLLLKAALERGAKLIVIDPRVTETAQLADRHLRIRYGTDAALALGWIHVIVEEGLFDREFVEKSCLGFDDLRDHVRPYTPEAVAGICGVTADEVSDSAREYAQASAAIIPWGATCDMQVNSTAAIQAQCILRAICGFLNVSESVPGPATGGVGVSQLADLAALPAEKRGLQLGADKHPLLTHRASDLYAEANARFGIDYEPDIMAESCACVPPALFAAMRGEGPYDVKATIIAANNLVMSYAGQAGIVEGLLNQDLVVVFEHWLTPTAQLADFVLPGDMWAERDVLAPQYDRAPMFSARRAVLDPVGQCKSWYYVVKGLADRLGFGERFPWADEHELFGWQLADLGVTWEDAVACAPAPIARELPARGCFVTPSGKVELVSSVLAALGCDPLPTYREPVDPGAASAPDGSFPYVAFAGSRDKKSYNTNLHQIEPLRKAEPDPLLFIHPDDARAEGIEEGEWCTVSSAYGSIELKAHLDQAQLAGTVRIPHGWWLPELPGGLGSGLSNAMRMNDGAVFPDEEWNLDPAQGLPNLRGGIHVRVEGDNGDVGCCQL